MARLIDADELKVKIDQSVFDADDNEWMKTLIDNAPTIDIVFCKECIHCADDYIDVGMGTMPQFTCEMGVGGDIVSPDDFCSYGERKESE